METFEEFLLTIPDPGMRERTREVLAWVLQRFPQLQTRIAWGQPTFTDHGTFIIAFSLAKAHLAVAPETKALKAFADDIRQAGYDTTKMLLKLPWAKPLPFALLEKIIAFNISDKQGVTTYWRSKDEW